MLLYLKITINDKKLLISVYSKPDDSHLYLDDASFHPAKSINGILTGAAKQLKQTRSNDIDFLEQSKKYSAYLAAGNQKSKEITRAFEKNNKQPISTVQHQRAKINIKPVVFTTQYNPLGPNISSIIKKHLPIIKDNTNLIEMFPKDSIFCTYKRFPTFRDLMVKNDPYKIKPLKEVLQDPGCRNCMKR